MLRGSLIILILADVVFFASIGYSSVHPLADADRAFNLSALAKASYLFQRLEVPVDSESKYQPGANYLSFV